MMMKSILTTILTIGCAAGHMMVATPPPRDSKSNPNVLPANINYNLVAPVTQFGCSQFHQTAPVANYTAGQSFSITIEGGAPHNGGSCQFGISFGGEQYISLRDDVGSCLIDGLTYTVTIPEGTPSGKAVIAWVWINKTGNREYYMNCIDVEIVGGPQSGSLTGRSITIANLPGYPTVPEGDSGISITQSLYNAEKTITISQGSGGNNVQVDTKTNGSSGSSGSQQNSTNSTGSAVTSSNAYQTGSAATTISNAYPTGSAATSSNAYQTGSAATTISNAYPTGSAATGVSNAYPTSAAATTAPNAYPTAPSAAVTTVPNNYPVGSATTTMSNAYPTNAAATTASNAYQTASSVAATTVPNAYPTAPAASTTAAYPVNSAASAAYPGNPTYPVTTYD